MSNLTTQQRELVAIGASIASNCIPCIKFHVQKGRESGLADEVIREAIEVADSVRQVPARNVLDAATAALGGDAAPNSVAQGGSACKEGNSARESVRTGSTPCCGPETET